MSDTLLPSTSFPSPTQLPEFWRTVVLGPHVIPPDPYQGAATCKVSPGLEVDSKKGKGQKKSTKTITGEKDATITVAVEFSEAIWPEMQAAIEGLNALRVAGKPVDIAHPNTIIHGISSMMILSVGDGVQWSNGVGSYTWEGEEWTSPDTTLGQSVILRRGSTGAEVSRWQQFLLDEGFVSVGAVDGIFGANTESATKEFQTREAILVDGIVGPQTFGAAAKHGYAPPPPLKGGGGSKTPNASKEAEDQIVDDAEDAADAMATAIGDALGDYEDRYFGDD